MVELLDELKETAPPAIAGLAEDERADVDEIVDMLTGNLEKIAEHGRRVHGIAKSMLEHPRGGSELGAAKFLTKPVDFDRLRPGCASCLPLPADKQRFGSSADRTPAQQKARFSSRGLLQENIS